MSRKLLPERTCQRCGETIPKQVRIEGQVYRTNTRRHCLRCMPIGEPRRYVRGKPFQAPRACRLCGSKIPKRLVIDGKLVITASRRYCLTCSPVGSRNTRRLELGPPPSPKGDAATQARRAGAPVEVRYAALVDRAHAWRSSGYNPYRTAARELQWIIDRIEDGMLSEEEHRDMLDRITERVDRWSASASVRQRNLADDYRFLLDRAQASVRTTRA